MAFSDEQVHFKNHGIKTIAFIQYSEERQICASPLNTMKNWTM